MRTLLIDNYDSFTFNLHDLLHRVNGVAPRVIANDTPWDEVDLTAFDSIVVSPGPGRPQRDRDLGISALALRQDDLPVLGICLGHQGISHLAGAVVGHAPEPMHGRVSDVHHDAMGLFEGIPSPFSTVRYHSLAVTDLPAELEPLAWTADGVVMAVRHRHRKQWGVQFHPESVLTDFGIELLHNFRLLATAPSASGPPARATPGARPRYLLEHRVLPEHPNTEALFAERHAGAEAAFWLDSSRQDLPTGRFSVMGDASGPLAERLDYSVPDRCWTVTSASAQATVAEGFFEYLGERLVERRVEHPGGLPIDFNLGYVGVLGYELKAETGGRAHHRSPLPDAQLVFADRAVVIDHRERRTHLLVLTDPAEPETSRSAAAWLESTAAAVRRHSATVPEPPAARPHAAGFRFDQTHTEYLKSIQACLNAINDGESYEICLTNTAESAPLADPLRAYRRLRAVSAVPFGAYLRSGSTTLLSASPERFLEIRRDGRVQAKPIKGTRPRAASPAEDVAIRRELAGNPKDRAENLMIVDLLRNDLNRVCTVGSVHAPTMFDVESYDQVHQLVSTIEGRLAPDRSVTDCLRSTFPGGSMTGAPKVRTMEIIDELEPRARGFYSGAVGWLSLCGAADLNIVIRTLVNSAGSCTFGVGGAIVSLSDPEAEYEETLVKARAMLTALDTSLEEA